MADKKKLLSKKALKKLCKKDLKEKWDFKWYREFGFQLSFCVTNDVTSSRWKLQEVYGPFIKDACNGLVSVNDEKTRYSIFLNRGKITHDLIGHEVFHLTHRILDGLNSKFNIDQHEFAAVLCGDLSGWVYSQLTENKEEIGHE